MARRQSISGLRRSLERASRNSAKSSPDGGPTRVALYARVSTDGQTVENQLEALLEVASRRGWHVVETYSDHGISGAKGRDKRPAFDAMLKDVVRGRIDLIASWSVDRLGRSLKDLIAFMDEIHAVGCDLYLHVQGVDTTTPAGRAMFQMLGVFAEFERAMVQERVRAGLDRAREAQAAAEAQGKRRLGKNGRPLKHGRLGRPPVPPEVEQAILERRAAGQGMLRIARELGVGSSTVQRVVKAAEYIT